MTPKECASIRHDMAMIEEKLYRMRLGLDANSAATVAEFAAQIRIVAADIYMTGQGAVEQEQRDAAA